MVALFVSENSTNVRHKTVASRLTDGAHHLLGTLAEGLRPWSRAEQAALAFLSPERVVSPPMLPEPEGGTVLAVPGFEPHLNARVWGPAGAPTVLLVHGWESHLYAMLPFVQPLLDQGLRVVAFDAPAHGRSSGETATLVDFARAITAVAKAAGGVRGIVGHSLGAAAVSLALEGGLTADRVVLLGTPAEPLGYAQECATLHHLTADETQAMLALLDRAFGRPVADISVAASAAHLAIPALFIHSVDDRVAPVHGALHAAALWRGARVHLVENLGHRRLLRDRGVVAKAVAFITETLQ